MDSLSYWADTTEKGKSYSDDPIPESVDCAIIGGGMTGISAAYYMASEGLKVALLEREHLGWGASTRNGGMAIPGIKYKVSALFKQHGIDATRRMFNASFESVQLLKKLIAEKEIDCDLQETGSFAAAYRPSHLKSLEKWQRTLADNFGHSTRLVPPERMKEELGTNRYYGGLVDDASIGVHPAKFMFGMVRCADEAGASLHENAAAEDIQRMAEGFEVKTARGRIRAKEVLIATNGYTGAATPELRRRVFPLGSYIMVTEPMDEALADRIIPKRRMIYDTKWVLFYFRILPDNRMMFGGRVSFTRTNSQKSGRLLRKGMVELFPEVAHLRVEYSWGGFLGMSFDRMAHTGQMEGMYYSMGYSGRGFSMAAYLGMKMAHIIAGKEDATPFSDLDFPTMILYRKRPWFMPLAGTYYRFKDLVS
ncbi:MAG: NAD(P)/FAD-dependent oxidoreductase [Anaerolineales bacterium]